MGGISQRARDGGVNMPMDGGSADIAGANICPPIHMGRLKIAPGIFHTHHVHMGRMSQRAKVAVRRIFHETF